ncbi:MAG: hypothetical protein LKJ86_10225 [Oscillibacter sp.]|jgi:hypothetical protein|nr:hypothetical protein [Oscillibacter sp.]
MNKKLLTLLLASFMALSLAACGQKTGGAAAGGSGSSAASEPSSSALTENPGEAMENLPVYPNTVGPLPSETEKLPALEKLIADQWEIPQKALADTVYLYNYIDLNNDGTDEIFAAVLGSYTSGSGGDSALIASQSADGTWTLTQAFTLVREPVLVSDYTTNGWRDLIIPQYGGGESGCYRVLSADANGKYPNVGDGKAVGDGENPSSLGDVSGNAILYNDVAADRTAGSLLTLG